MAEDEEEMEESPVEKVETFGLTSILRLVIFGGIIAFIAAVLIGMILGMPILRGIFPGFQVRVHPSLRPHVTALVVNPGLTALATDPVQAILDAFINGLVSVVNAVFAGIVFIGNTAVSVIATIITAIFLPPVAFFKASWDAATGALMGFGIGAPVASMLVIIAVGAVFGIGGFLLIRGIRETAQVAED